MLFIMKESLPIKQWLPLLGLTVAAFMFNTSEFMPIGLLTDIAADFQMTPSQAGVIITAYSWAVMLLSLPLMIAVSRFNFRWLLLAVILLFGTCQVLSAVAGSYTMLMFSRIGVACAHAVFWSIAAPVAVQLVSSQFGALALSMIVTGKSIAMILGMPLGRVIGLYIGWRMTFICVAVIAFAVCLYLAAVFPKLSSNKPFSLKELPQLMQNKKLLGIYLLIFLMAASYYTAYSYIEPFLKQAAGLDDDIITFILMIFGTAGLIGSFLFSRCYSKYRASFLKLSMIGVAVSLLLLYPAAYSPYTVIIICISLGIAMTSFNIAFQAETINAVGRQETAVAMAIFSAIFNLGIGSGSWIGGHISLPLLGYAGGILALIASFICIVKISKVLLAVK